MRMRVPPLLLASAASLSPLLAGCMGGGMMIGAPMGGAAAMPMEGPGGPPPPGQPGMMAPGAPMGGAQGGAQMGMGGMGMGMMGGGMGGAPVAQAPMAPPPAPPATGGPMAQQQAIDAAAAYARSQGLAVDRTQRAVLDGDGRWHVELRGPGGNRARVLVDARTGQILRARLRGDDED